MTTPATLPVANGPTLPRALRPLALMEEALRWLIAHPLLTFQVVLFWLIAWGGLGSDLGLDDIFWHESVTPQFVVGLCVGLLFKQVLFVRYILGSRRVGSKPGVSGATEASTSEKPKATIGDLFSLYPVKDPAIRGLGRFLLVAWPIAVGMLIAPKFLSLRGNPAETFWVQAEPFFPLVVGLGVAGMGSTLLVMLGEHLGLRARVERSMLFRMTPGIAWGYLPQKDYPLHSLALLLGMLFSLGVAIAVGLHTVGHVLITPYLALCLLFAVVNGVYGFLASQLRGLQFVAILLMVVSGVLLNSDTFDPDHDYRMSFPHMEDYYVAVRKAATQDTPPEPSEFFVRLDEEFTGTGYRDKVEYYRQLLADPKHSPQAAGLLDSEETLRAMTKRWQEKHPGTKPRLIVVSTSGGGIRAAVWTAIVLEGLEETIPGLRDHIRLISGASGGMVGAGLYASDFERPSDPKDIDPRTGLGTFSRMLAKDSLTPTVQTMLLSDLPAVWIPRDMTHDRGRELEEAWYRNSRRGDDPRSPLDRSFTELRDLERQGLRPSLVYTPMLVEDSRRLIISNLDLHDLTMTFSQQCGGSDYGEGGALEKKGQNLRTQRALSAVEFFRLFPKATEFRVSTAARMNASFPLVSPAVNLPTYPPRRVVDAGYYDNYGINVAALWMLRHQKALRELTSGVMLIEISSSRNAYSRRHFQQKERIRKGVLTNDFAVEEVSKDLVAQSLEGLATPAEAVLTAQDRSSLYRNDELLDLVDRALNLDKDSVFFTSVAFECHKPAALSWVLDRGDAWLIASSFWKDKEHKEPLDYIGRRLGEMKEWFGQGGK